MNEAKPQRSIDLEIKEFINNLPEYAVAYRAAKLLQDAGFEAYIIGGAVRDILLGKIPKDFDLATNAKPEEVLAVEGFLKSKFTDTAQAYAVTRVRLAKPNNPLETVEIEIATFRRDIDAHLGRKATQVEVAGQLEEDVIRRDFTINAMALDPVTSQLFDYVGGLKDLDQKLIRFVGQPAQRIKEDPLRILREIRFKNRLNFQYESASEQAIIEAVLSGALETIPVERLRDELTHILVHPSRAQALEDLDRLGILKRLLPEVKACQGVEQSADVHAEGDVWQHKLILLENLTGPPDIEGRPTLPSRRLAWSALLHDIGKPATQQLPVQPGGRITFYGHETVGAEKVAKILAYFKFPLREAEEIIWLEENHMRITKLVDMSLAKQRQLMNHPAFADLLEICRADGISSWVQQEDGTINRDQKSNFAAIEALWHAHLAQPPEVQKPSLKRDLGIDGRWLMTEFGLKPSPTLGRILHQLEAEFLDGRLADQATARQRVNELLTSDTLSNTWPFRD